MKKEILALILFFVLAASSVKGITFEKKVLHPVLLKEPISIPAEYKLFIMNDGPETKLNFSSTIKGVKLQPKEVRLARGKNELELNLLLSQDIKELCGAKCNIEYLMQVDNSIIRDTLPVRIFSVEQVIKVSALPISYDSKKLELNVTNLESLNLGLLSLNFNSEFGSATKNFSLGAGETKEIEVELDQNKVKEALAGDYSAKLTFFINNEYSYELEISIKLEEHEAIKTETSKSIGIFSVTSYVTKHNFGNSPKTVEITLKKSRFEHAFFSSEPKPSIEQFQDGSYVLKWQKQLQPGESFKVRMTQNYTSLFGIGLIAAVALLGIYFVRKPKILIRKKVYKVNTKGGEYALKTLIWVKALKGEARNTRCWDKLPAMTQLHERFGAIQPSKIEGDRIEWEFGDLQQGEEKVVSYICWSKIHPVGGMTLPKAGLSWQDAEGKTHLKLSNKVSTP